jgi:hypothetical protein
MQAGLDATNEVHNRSNSGIKFIIDPQTNFTGFVNSTILNTDCLVPDGVVPEKITVDDVNGDGKVDGDDKKMVCDPTIPAAERTAFALKYPHSVVAFARGVALVPKWDGAAGHWTIAIPTGGYSSCEGAFIVVRKDFGGGTFFAHESGHYLCSPHTFAYAPADVAAAAQIIKNYVEGNNIDRNDPMAALNVFDADRSATVYDTPPDPSYAIFVTLYGDACDPSHGRFLSR